MARASSHNPHPPMYPMYPEKQKSEKPKPKMREERLCLCISRRKHKNVIEIVRERVEGSRLEFWSVYALPYAFVIMGLTWSVASPLLGLIFIHKCPALPMLVPVLIGRLPLGLLDAFGGFLMTAEAFSLGKSYPWIQRLLERVNWRVIAGWILALSIAWLTVLFTAAIDTGGQTISYDPHSPFYCHEVLYKFLTLSQAFVVISMCGSVALLLLGSILLMFLLCITARIGS